MKRLSRFFIIILAVSVSIAACSPPVGNISSKGGLEDMWAVPKRVVYEHNSEFRRTDLTVLGMYRGAVETIPIEQVTIEIIENPEFAPDVLTPFPLEEESYFWIGDYGRKIIVIKYHDREAYYSVEVLEPGIPIEPPGGGGGSGIGWEWLPELEIDPDPDP
jgi:hypothetical protein